MALSAYLRRISQTELVSLQAQPHRALDLFLLDRSDLELSRHIIDLDWSWRALRFLLQQTTPYAQSSASQAIAGGELIWSPNEQNPEEPPILLLRTDEVANIAQAFLIAPAETLRQHIRADRLREAQLLPSNLDTDAAAQDALMPFFYTLVQFFHEAAAAHEAVLTRVL